MKASSLAFDISGSISEIHGIESGVELSNAENTSRGCIAAAGWAAPLQATQDRRGYNSRALPPSPMNRWNPL